MKDILDTRDSVSDGRLKLSLMQKVLDFTENESLSELCGIFEALYAIMDSKGISKEDVEAARPEGSVSAKNG